MKALLVYESVFGNTEQIARAVAEGLSRRLPVQTLDVGRAPLTLGSDIGLIVVGGPTHVFGLSRADRRTDGHADTPADSRADSLATDGANGSVVTHGRGLKTWLEGLHVGASGVAAAAFDTRVNRPRLPGSAARAADRQMRRQGMHPIVLPHSFHVRRTTGPLADGESEQARQWGEQVAVELLHGLARARS
jgi:flavodoxin